jgi:hypothetical protein
METSIAIQNKMLLLNLSKKNIMKKLVLISLLSFFFFTNIEAQEIATGKSKHSFVEWNFGLAYITGSGIAQDIDLSPGTSVLWGKTYINENNFIFEYEAGFALPGIVTGKVGMGKKFDNTKVIVGVRPYPFNLFLQSSFATGKKGYWITSIELNPLDTDKSISVYSKAILNFGYRWN